MKTMKIIKIYSILLLILATATVAHDYVPGVDQDHPILLKGGNLYTVSDGILNGYDLLFENGKISQIGQNIVAPENSEIIDVSGKNVYPGLISANSSIGLIEIGAVDATNDIAEKGKNNADVQSHIAYNPDSEIIPSVRSNGITTALIVPGGRLIKGQSSLINLDGWTKEDAMEKQNVGLHVGCPGMSIISAWWMEKTPEEQKKEHENNIKAIFQLFDEAKIYFDAKKADPAMKIDSRWEAMIPALKKEMPVFIHASDIRQIKLSVALSIKYDLDIIIVGGNEAWKAADLLKENNIPVILNRTQTRPMRQDDAYDQSYTQPKLLLDAGIKFCLSYGSATSERNLPFQAGQAAAFGLTKEEALRSITLSVAEILGVEKELGSLEIGKKATLIVSDGDVLDMLGNNIILEFINGKMVDLNNRHKELYNKYRQKNL